MTGWKAHITSEFQIDGIGVYLVLEGSTQRRLLRQDGSLELIDQSNPVAMDPTFTIQDDAGRALLDALTRYYQGASDMTTVRQDLLHERGRVDNLIGMLQRVFEAGAGIAPDAYRSGPEL